VAANEGGADRFARWSIGIMLVLIALSGAGWTGPLITGLLGVGLLVTGTIGWCPLYSLFHFTTLEAKS
jgi:hypothetical protein